MKLSLLLSLSIFFISLNSFSQSAKYSNEFLSVGVGARALGMSNSVVSSVSDVTAGYWNPAGLLNLNTNSQLAIMHSEYFAGIAKYDYAGWAKIIDSSSSIGISLLRFGVDDIPNTTELIDANGNIDYNKVTSFSAADYAFLLSYSQKLNKVLNGLKVGANAKIIRRVIGDFAGSWGFGIDVAGQYQYKGWNFGVMARDITTTFNAWSFNLTDDIKNAFILTGNEIPTNSIELTLPRLILGSSKKVEFYDSKFSLLSEINLDATFDGKRNAPIKSDLISIDPHIGFEIGFKNYIFLRTGIGNIQKTKDIIGKSVTTLQPNIGLGVKIKNVTIDYALTDIGDNSVALYSNVFSLKLDLTKKLNEKK